MCQNGVDDDGDGYVDCHDTECVQTFEVTVCRGSEDTWFLCHDGQDNDNDGWVDCADCGCEDLGCLERTDEFCSDGMDNDGDNFADCEDFGCKYGCLVTVCGVQENSSSACGDNIDNDGDRYMDCDDRGCQDCVPACGGSSLGEDTRCLCTDGIDNDGDGVADCRDSDCYRLEEKLIGCDTGVEATLEACSDGEDNDNDPWIDCEDPNCQDVADCTENTALRCADGIDNDGDTHVDCVDFDCSRLDVCGEGNDVECSDNVDNDGNGYIDCLDFGCRFGCNVTVCPGAEKTRAQCVDGIDNDNDRHTDCDDEGCQECIPECAVGENTLEFCTNSIDDDGDEAVDCRDIECLSVTGAGCNVGDEICDDEIDNDNDPWIDCADVDCWGAEPCVEEGNVRCSDLIDNDGDSFLDCADNDCLLDPDVTICDILPENTDARCSDVLDNDHDGAKDCDDSDCWANAALEVCPAAVTTSIAAIQDPNHPEHITILDGESRVRVRVQCVTVTSAVKTDRWGTPTFFAQATFPPNDVRYQGIEMLVIGATPSVFVGDRINVVGFYSENAGASVIQVGKVEIAGGGDCGGEPVEVVTPAPRLTQDLVNPIYAEPYEGVLVQLAAVVVTDVNVESRPGVDPELDDFAVLELSAPTTLVSLIVDTRFAAQTPEEGQVFGYLTGQVTYSWGRFRVAPRAAIDYGPPEANLDDDDDDGLTNIQEMLLGTSATRRDTDGDGDDDLTEVIDPTTPPDSDCDGVIDALESSIGDGDGDGINDEADRDNNDGPNGDVDNDGDPNSSDPNDDGDNVCDPGVFAAIASECSELADNCPAIVNDDQVDSDLDGLGDLCDPDKDGDSSCNPEICVPVPGQCGVLGDNCPADHNVDQLDTDEDGAGDACDPDDDNDSVCDPGETVEGVCVTPGGDGDNCPLVPNSGQNDADDDGRGDVCDPDDDNDSVCDPGEQDGTEGCIYVGSRPDNCPTVQNTDQLDTDGDGVGDACEDLAIAPTPGDMVVNEVLSDPSPGDDGDANGDGSRDSADDEFVELVNVSGSNIDLAGCDIVVNGTVRHRFVSGADPLAHVVADKTGLVVFGGGAPVGTFGGAIVVKASTGSLTISNSSGDVELRCAVLTIDTAHYTGGNVDQSYTRRVEGDNSTDLVPHTNLAAGVFFSPGTCTTGQVFADCL